MPLSHGLTTSIKTYGKTSQRTQSQHSEEQLHLWCTADNFCLWRPIPIPILMSCIMYILYLSRTVCFPKSLDLFLFLRHYYTITISALVARMGGAVWHDDGFELSSAIRVLSQSSGGTSEVRVQPVIEY